MDKFRKYISCRLISREKNLPRKYLIDNGVVCKLKLSIYVIFTLIVPQKTKARRGGRSGKVTAVINIKLKEAMKIKVN